MSLHAWQALEVVGILTATTCWLGYDIRKARRKARADVQAAIQRRNARRP